ncbi:MAG: hypothetical protein NTV97_23175 [Alphaproteobacteria bacterium]|nr:hypothetical protein [Alphaproteobacteria bacterium]
MEAFPLVASPGSSSIYIYRPGWIGSGSELDLFLDGRPVGSLFSKRYMVLVTSPGSHSIGAKLPVQSGEVEDGRGMKSLAIEVGDGKVAAVRLSWAVFGGIGLESNPDLADAGRYIAKAKRVEPTAA